jgi:hypothetical protein
MCKLTGLNDKLGALARSQPAETVESVVLYVGKLEWLVIALVLEQEVRVREQQRESRSTAEVERVIWVEKVVRETASGPPRRRWQQERARLLPALRMSERCGQEQARRCERGKSSRDVLGGICGRDISCKGKEKHEVSVGV